MPKFSDGQIVQLRSGGPRMTVCEPCEPNAQAGRTETSYRCQWFFGIKLSEGYFAESSLIPVPAAGPG